MKRPLILISNDDSLLARGVNELARIASSFGDVVVVAPDRPRSGAGCSITSSRPVRLKIVHREPWVQVYSCTGTPVDCIKLAKQAVLRRKPDLVLGGINHGDNSGINVHYSGTMGIVMEGCICGIPSVGFSIDDHSPEADFSHCEKAIRDIIARVLSAGLPRGVCLNVNFPVRGPLQGVKLCRQSCGQWINEWIEREHPKGGKYYWLTGNLSIDNPDDTDTDHYALQQGYAAITPVRIDLTARDVWEELEQTFAVEP